MIAKNNTIGSTGENIACGYLENKGYKIIDRNYRTKFGELDIIVKSPDKVLIFCEVKTVKVKKKEGEKEKNLAKKYPQEFGNGVDKLGKVWQGLARKKYSAENDCLKPEDQMTYSKIKKFKKIAEWYANKNLENLKCKSYRLDLIAVDLYNNEDEAKIRWYKGII